MSVRKAGRLDVYVTFSLHSDGLPSWQQYGVEADIKWFVSDNSESHLTPP